MRVVLLENEPDVAVQIKDTLEVAQGMVVECIYTEYEFRRRIHSLTASPPSAFVLDVIVDWTEPGVDVCAPIEVVKDGPFYAGVRCYSLLSADPRTEAIPVVFYSGCRRSDLDGMITGPINFLSKDYGDHRELLRLLEELIRR